jgi:hypothetical protein
MTKKKFLWGMLVFVFGLVLAGCPTDNDNDSDGDGDGGNNGTPATSGKLTITGLSSYNSKFAYVTGSTGGGTLLTCGKATSDTNIEAVLISNGQVVLSVYQFTGGKYVSYSGSGTVSNLYITIFPSNVMNGAQKIASGYSSSVAFASGIATVDSPTLTAVP